MAEPNSGAILMVFTTLQNQAIAGESTTSVKAADGVSDQVLMDGFAPKKMFEVETFAFSTKLDDDQSPTADSEKIDNFGRGLEQTNKVVAHLAARGGPGLPPGALQPTRKLNFARWRASTTDQEFKGNDGRNGYMVNVQPVSFTRHVDRTSFRLMECFLNAQPFLRAALVKRKPAGTKAVRPICG
jgi:hypothetical protein